MATTATKTKAAKVKNGACPRCDGPMFFSRERWLHCPACRHTKAGSKSAKAAEPIPFALAK